MTTTVKAKFRPSTVEDRPGTIVYLVTHRRIARQITTGYKVFPCEWDEERSELVLVSDSSRTDIINRITQKLRSDMERLKAIIKRFDNGRSSYSSDDVVAEFRRTERENTFFNFMENVIERLWQLNHIGTAKNYRAALGSFRQFRSNVDISIASIDHVLMEDYQAYMTSAGLTPNSISFYMRILRAVYNRAVEQELTEDRRPFRTVFTGLEKTRKRAISISDIKRIRDLDLSLNEKGFEKALKNIWTDLQHTKPDFPSFEDIQNGVTDILDNTEIMVVPLNSKSFVCRDSSNPDALDLSKGFNIVIGGNTLGRGITFPHLQTVYYCRSAKRMQADTFWQHSRIFGYDREKELVRIFIPQPLYKFFVELNKSNEMLIEQVTHGLENLQVILPADISPTRKNVLDSKYLNAIVGGMNFFASNPVDSNTDVIDSIVSQYGDALSVPTDKETVINLLQLVGSYDSQDFSSQKYISCVHALCAKRPSVKLRLIVRKNREISKGTGTLLSENDRKLGSKFDDEIVLTLYRINGEVAKGWNGKPLWIPNIKFPKNICFYDTFEN